MGDPIRHRSGEWPDFVTNAQFSQFVETFNNFASDNRADMGAIRNSLANGQSTMAVMDMQIKQTIERTDEHSGVLKILSNEVHTKLATDKAKHEATEYALKPYAKIRERIVNTVVTIVVGSVCALAWHVIMSAQPPANQPTQTNINVTPSK